MNFAGLIFIFIFILFIPKPAHALLPPDMIFSVGSSVVQFFSIAALVVGGVFSSIVYTGRRWLALSNKKVWLIISVIATIVLVAIAISYGLEVKRQQVSYLEHIALLESVKASLEQKIEESVPRTDYQQLIKRLNQKYPLPSPDSFVSTSSDSSNKRFLSDAVTIYGGATSTPFILEVDFNRIERGNGMFSHYTFLNGYYQNSFFSDYDAKYSDGTDLVTNRFVKSIEKKWASDSSPRDKYQTTVLLNGEPMEITISDIAGDFVTRNQPTYTQFQSVGTAEVKYRGQTFAAQALVESSYSSDYSKKIFFPGYKDVEATTHQFVLWDEDENFYLIDNSVVQSNTPEYPSHTWLLYKNKKEGTSKKSFEAEVETSKDNDGKISWQVRAPGFNNAVFTLASQVPFKQKEDERIRAIVSGTVTNASGTKAVGGVLHLVK
ncbi:hypothetical protein H6784_03285 [Candidatus Nomurabacteria bacterium]|nr:hypothetical protein [Candidatus Kaiserbacteria bacterium]MCB9811147.1 hypothetical protein [Candidatus Nomurabacteria bacterium]MCB9814416.1 hypothetical protein [Candidatus Nomurabacteria bacterium]